MDTAAFHTEPSDRESCCTWCAQRVWWMWLVRWVWWCGGGGGGVVVSDRDTDNNMR